MQLRAHKELWGAVREDLRSRVGEGKFDRWIAPLKVLSEDGQEIRLAAVNLFVQDWIERHYLSLICSAIKERLGSDSYVQLVIDGDLPESREGRETPNGEEGGRGRSSSGSPPPATCTEGGGPPGGGPPTDAVVDRTGSARGGRDGDGESSSPGGDDSCGGDGSLGREEGGSPLRHRGGPRVDGAETGEKSRAQEQTLETFVVGSSNRLAYNAVLQVLDAPGVLYNPLFLCGPSGVGKTHLLKGLQRVLRSRRCAPRAANVPFAAASSPGGADRAGGRATFQRVAYVTGEQFFHHFSSSIQDGTSRKFRDRFRSLDALLVDDVQLLVNKRKTQLEFLHTFNSLVESGRQVVIASDVPPKALKELDAGLVTRFLSGLVVGIRKPDYETRLGIVRMQARRLRSHLEGGVLEYLAEHIRGNARELVGALMKLDIHAQLGGGSLAFGEARDLLGEFVCENNRQVSLTRICDLVGDHFGFSREGVCSRSRKRHVSRVRQVAMFLARRYTGHSLAEIGKYFGKRNHTTVRCAEKKIAHLLEDKGSSLARDVRAILEKLEG